MKKYAILLTATAIGVLILLYNSFLYTIFLTNEDVLYKVSRMIKNPEICKKENKDFYSIAKNIHWSGSNLKITEYINAMPKRIDYKIIDNETRLPIYHVVYRVDGGCDGLFISKD
ncbi:hypothetical protein ACFIQG_20545 [Comamonas odontotermitis]|uniref:hypothetical protein n=1 Tax=Comamonas odontotermitis TaxID=379895 RepID=UPI00366FFC5C